MWIENFISLRPANAGLGIRTFRRVISLRQIAAKACGESMLLVVGRQVQFSSNLIMLPTMSVLAASPHGAGLSRGVGFRRGSIWG
jgi:hypothetical protein